MRTTWKLSALSLLLVLGACGRRQEKAAALPDDLKRDLVVATVGGDLAIATKGYQRARFVSSVEQTHTAQPEPRPKRAPSAQHAMVAHQHTSAATTEDVPEPAMVMASAAPDPDPAPTTMTPEPAVETAPQPAPQPVQQAGAGDEIRIANRGHGGGWGSMIGGIIGSVVIRGGLGGADKCDPRYEGRGRTTVMISRPDYGNPAPYGTPVFAPRR